MAKCAITFLLFIGSLNLCGQQVELVKDKCITSPAHQAYVGKIVFTATDAAANGYNPDNFLQCYQLTPKSNLYMTVFLQHSLTNNLHHLVPQAIHDALTRDGSLHFSFYVDGQLIHEDNLHPASLFPEQKNAETIISKPLTVHPFTEWWSNYLWFKIY